MLESAVYWSVNRKTTVWYLSAIFNALTVWLNASSAFLTLRTILGNSPCDALKIKLKSLCSVLVGSPVAGPGLWESTTTSGISAMPASPRDSTISEKPPPELPVIARAPAYDAPIAKFMALISSSAWSTTISTSFWCFDK